MGKAALSWLTHVVEGSVSSWHARKKPSFPEENSENQSRSMLPGLGSSWHAEPWLCAFPRAVVPQCHQPAASKDRDLEVEGLGRTALLLQGLLSWL